MTPPGHIVALVVAAGSSSRLGRLKPLTPLGSSTFITEIAGCFHQAGIRDIRVVIGDRSEEIIPVLERLEVQWIVNTAPDRGMFSSVLTGLESIPSDAQAFFLMPSDIPLVKPQTIEALLGAHVEHSAKIIYPRFNGERGHPPLIPTSRLSRDVSPDYPGGMRAILARHEADALDVDVVDEGILIDCDTPSDYRRILRRWMQSGIPTEAECEALYSRCKVSERVAAHCGVVAEITRILAISLMQAGCSIDLPLALAAARLHDVARDKPDHAIAGAALLEEMGYPRVASVVGSHTDIQVKAEAAAVSEAELLYVADKCAQEDRLVTFEERFDEPLSRFAQVPEILPRIVKRLDDARLIGKRIEHLIEAPIPRVLTHWERSIQASSRRRRRNIYLARHGAVAHPDESRRFIGQMDLPLIEAGIRQAERLSEFLRETPLSAVFCSDLKRSIETAEIVARDHDLPCIPRRGLREVSLGQWDGMSFDSVIQSQPEAFEARGRDILHYRPPGGESFLDCMERVIPAFHAILAETQGNLLIVGHAGVNRILLSQFLGRSMETLLKIEQDYGCLNVVTAQYGRFQVRQLNGAPFQPAD